MAILRDACKKGLIAHNAHRAKHIDTLPMELDDKLCQDAQVISLVVQLINAAKKSSLQP